MKRILLPLLILLLIPICVWSEETDDWDDGDDWDWRADWEEYGYFDFCDVQDDTLIIFEGVEALGEARTIDWDEETDEDVEVEPKFEDGPSFAWYESGAFHRVSLPSTLRYLGMEAFCAYDFAEFTLPAQLEVLEHYAFYGCDFDVLRIETTLPVEDILNSMDYCSVNAYEVPEDHPLYKTIDGVLFSKDGKTLLSYPNNRKAEHYDVPAGVERIEDIHNENLKTISLPIGLKSVADYGFGGCTRLQAIALPLTVTEIGEEIFSGCLSLELVSLPEGLEAEKDESGYWVEYYPDDALFRGDNGDTLGGVRSEGKVSAPGRVFNHQAEDETNWYEKNYTQIYDTADARGSYRYYRNGKIVFMGWYENGRVALYEPLGGNYTGSGYGNIIGWANLADVQYLQAETLFAYADIQPRSTLSVWWNHLPDYTNWTPWETVIPLAGRTYEAALFGPYVRFKDSATKAVFACAIQDADITRKPDGSGNVYGIVYNTEFLEDIPLMEGPDGEALKTLVGGTQIQILDEKEGWYQVTDGRDTGWVEKDHVKIIPEEGEAQ